MSEHSINRSGTAANSDGDKDNDVEEDESQSEREIKRELRNTPIGEALLRRNRELRRREGGLRR